MKGEAHLRAIQEEGRALIRKALKAPMPSASPPEGEFNARIEEDNPAQVKKDGQK
jgi:hypothetical protein